MWVSALLQRLAWARGVYDAVAGADVAGRTDGEVASSIGSARDAAGVGAWTSVMLSACAGVAARVMLSGCATANRTAAEATNWDASCCPAPRPRSCGARTPRTAATISVRGQKAITAPAVHAVAPMMMTATLPLSGLKIGRAHV